MAAKRPLVLNANGEVSVLKNGDVIDPSCLGSGVANATTVLAGDSTYKTPSGGSDSPASNIFLAANFV